MGLFFLNFSIEINVNKLENDSFNFNLWLLVSCLVRVGCDCNHSVSVDLCKYFQSQQFHLLLSLDGKQNISTD